MVEKNQCIIFEEGFTGHRSEYVSHLMRHINAIEDLHGKFIFILNEKMGDFIGDLKTSPFYSVVFLNLSAKQKNSLKRSFYHWSLISPLLPKFPAMSEIIFMEVDPYLILISSKNFRKHNLKVRGILFQPYLHFKEITPKTFDVYKQLLKNYLFQRRAVLGNPNLEKLFILNDKESVATMNKKIKNIFCNLPDPILESEFHSSDEKFRSVEKKFLIQPGKKNLLVFGSIDKRKNVNTIIDSLLLLPAEISNDVHLIIAGKMSGTVRDTYIDHIANSKDRLSIAYNDDFIYGEEREILFEKCHLVVMPYVNFYSASSVLGHAIFYNKNIIAPKKGLLGRIVRTEKLGINVDPLSTTEIKDAVLQLLLHPGEYAYDNKLLMEEYNARNFSKSILED